MLRTGVAGFGLVAALLLAPLALAQSGPENCNSRTDNDPFMVDVDRNGLWLVQDVFFEDEGHPTYVEVARGGCYKVSVDNMDEDASHTITLSGHGLRITVGPGQFYYSDTSLVFFKSVGNHTLRDEPSGDEFEIRVVEATSSTPGPSEPKADAAEGVPGLAPLALLTVLASVAGLRRRF